ncbi:Uncharacterised protein [Yersinia similis]|nr:Uncharacterised protein [Yersinia similis]
MINLFVDQKKMFTLACVYSRRTDFFIIKKGSTSNTALWRYMYQPFGSIPKRSNSFLPNVFSQLARLTPAAAAAASNCSFNSGVIRIWKGGDLPAPRDWLSLIDMCTPIALWLLFIGVHLSTVEHRKETPPNSITSTERGLATTDNQSIEAAMKNNTTAPQRFTFLFLAVVRANPQAHPHREQISATSEWEARSLLAGRFVLVFAGRLPLSEVCHA